MPVYTQVHTYLLSLLKAELSAKTYPDVFRQYDSAQDIGSDLIHQLVAYVCQEPPFRLRANKDEKPMGYWMRLQKDKDSALLAVSPKLAISVDHLSIYSLRYLVSSFSLSFPPPLWMSGQSPDSPTLMHQTVQDKSQALWCI